jgi:phosphoglucosamine mutase
MAGPNLFGTDGIRGVAGEFPLDAASVWALGRALARLLADRGLGRRVLVGRDTRESGGALEAALVSGLRAAGADPVSVGVIPTSAVSLLAWRGGFAAGAVISASHNPFRDNGIKIFHGDGAKSAEDWETELEEAILKRDGKIDPEAVPPDPDPSLIRDYVDFLKTGWPPARAARRLKVVLDCAHGAASVPAPAVFRDLGFEVLVLNASPDGRNINAGCGSLHPEGMARSVRQAGADFGVAYDGDADRAVWADETGRVLNGDHTLYIQARFLKASGRLASGAVVATTMSNMGLDRALGTEGLRLIRTQVGDKNVREGMVRSGANLGGERSGHTIFLDYCPTGDGILTSLRMAETLRAGDGPLSALAAGLVEFPQVLVNVRVKAKPDLDGVPAVASLAAAARRDLGEEGRVELRYSGTEPLARIMLEGRDEAVIGRWAKRLAEAVAAHIGDG